MASAKTATYMYAQSYRLDTFSMAITIPLDMAYVTKEAFEGAPHLLKECN